MFGIGTTEMLLILAIALIVIGPKKLPEIAKALGKGFAEFKRATQDIRNSLDIDNEVGEVKDAFNDFKRKAGQELADAVDVTASDPYEPRNYKDEQKGESLGEDQAAPEDDEPDNLSTEKKESPALNNSEKKEDLHD